MFFTGSLSNSPKKSSKHFSAFSGHPVLVVDVPGDEADDTTDTTLAVFDGGMSEKISKLKMNESSNKNV